MRDSVGYARRRLPCPFFDAIPGGDRRDSNPRPSLESQSRMMRSSVSPTFAWVVVKIIVNNTTTHVEPTAPTVDLKWAKNRGAKEDTR